ncbi:hypothetical protein [uncultured Piscinibacter sp.]|uniref:hypothetical protein n=1 Tax=uncultured Piscinibacter sp. TaxID=1131835 RepID=UPI002602BAFB|nr:hypothetical protein [uncultured Piscinibacter sp.]
MDSDIVVDGGQQAQALLKVSAPPLYHSTEEVGVEFLSIGREAPEVRSMRRCRNFRVSRSTDGVDRCKTSRCEQTVASRLI